MDMLPTLCTAMKRAGGDCLVLRTGEPPHVLIGSGRQNVARAILSSHAVEALVSQIFSDAGQKTLKDATRVDERVTVPEAGLTLTARAQREGDQISIELREYVAEPTSPAVAPAPAPSDAESQQWLEVPFPDASDAAFDAVPSFAVGTEADGAVVEPSDPPVHEIVALDPLGARDAADDTPAVRYEELFLQVPAAREVDVAVEVRAHEAPEHLDAPDHHASQASVPLVEEPQAWGPTASASQADTPEPFVSVHEEPVVTSSNLEFIESPSHHAPTRESLPTGLAGWVARAGSRGATALYLRAGAVPLVRVEERLEPLASEAVGGWLFDELLSEFNGGRSNGWEPGGSGEWTRQEPGVGQVSGWAFVDDQGPGLMVRLRGQVSARGLYKFIPRKVREACDGDGLVVVSAAATADVAAIAAAVGDLAGRQRGGYVIALRPAGAPRHEISGAFVSQREFSGSDGDVAAAIRSAASESPDVLIVAPPASEAAMREAVHAADGGRLVILAVLAPTSMQALRAIVGRASAGGDAQTRLALATSFRAAFAYRVLQRLGGGRTLVRDLIVGTSEISGLLASGDFAGVSRVQREGSMSMTTVDDALARAVRRGHLSLRQAASHAVDKRYLVSLVRSGRRQQAGAPERHETGAAPTASYVLEPVGIARRADAPRWSNY